MQWLLLEMKAILPDDIPFGASNNYNGYDNEK